MMNVKANLEALQAGILSASEIQRTNWPEPVWAVPDLLPVGLAILAGRPKVGKSWLGLQLALSIATGGMIFGREVEQGSVLCLTLEDSPRRLKKRMEVQGWPKTDLSVSFMGINTFSEGIGSLKKVGVAALAELISANGYRLVVIDTFSKALGCRADQLGVGDMTAILSPLQEMAQRLNIVILIIDHHKKPGVNGRDVLDDILGSTAKGAIPDSIWGLYKERGKAGATLAITGRDIEEQELSLRVDWEIGCWQCEDSDEMAMTEYRQAILGIVGEMGPIGCIEIANALDKNKGTVHRELQELVKAGLVRRDERGETILYEVPSHEQATQLEMDPVIEAAKERFGAVAM